MFYLKHFIHKINLSPQFLGPNIHKLIEEYLIKTVEGSCSSSGYIISVFQIDNISEGRILSEGQVAFKVKYRAIILNPMKGEVVDAQIASKSKMGYFSTIGPLSIFISHHQIPPVYAESLNIGMTIRLKIIGSKIDSTKVYAIGTLQDDCLGPI